jgi:hypothetical protein
MIKYLRFKYNYNYNQVFHTLREEKISFQKVLTIINSSIKWTIFVNLKSFWTTKTRLLWENKTKKKKVLKNFLTDYLIGREK